jgi:hypothetical protein
MDQIFGFISGLNPKVSKLLRRHHNGESDGKEEEAPMLGPGPEKRLGEYYELQGIPTWFKYLRTVQDAQEAVVTAFWWLVGPKGRGGYGSPHAGLLRGQPLRPRMTKIDPSQG